MNDKRAGFEEIAHTADCELKVWAPDLPGLMEQAALGMYQLMGVRLKNRTRKQRILKIQAPDAEGLLVSFLSELLYLSDMEGIAFQQFAFTFQTGEMMAKLEGASILSSEKEIKAVTYHNLNIQETRSGLGVCIVFDV